MPVLSNSLPRLPRAIEVLNKRSRSARFFKLRQIRLRGRVEQGDHILALQLARLRGGGRAGDLRRREAGQFVGTVDTTAESFTSAKTFWLKRAASVANSPLIAFTRVFCSSLSRAPARTKLRW